VGKLGLKQDMASSRRPLPTIAAASRTRAYRTREERFAPGRDSEPMRHPAGPEPVQTSVGTLRIATVKAHNARGCSAARNRGGGASNRAPSCAVNRPRRRHS